MTNNYLIGLSPWGAMIAGCLIILVAQIGFSLLGLALGLMPLRARMRGPSAQQLGVGASIYWGVTSLISIFAGTWFASHLSGPINTYDAVLTGILTWALAGLIGVYIASTSIGTLIGGSLGAVMSGLKSMGASLGGIGGAAGATGMGMSGQKLRQSWPQLRNEFEDMIKHPEYAKAMAGKAQSSASDTDTLFRQIMSQAMGPGPMNKESVATTIQQKTHISHEQAEMTADRLVTRVQDMKEKIGEVKEQVTEKSKEVAHDIGIASLWTFVLYLVSIGVAVWGSWAGAVRV